MEEEQHWDWRYLQRIRPEDVQPENWIVGTNDQLIEDALAWQELFMKKHKGMWSARQEAGRSDRARSLMRWIEANPEWTPQQRVEAIAAWFKEEWARATTYEKARAKWKATRP